MGNIAEVTKTMTSKLAAVVQASASATSFYFNHSELMYVLCLEFKGVTAYYVNNAKK